MTGLFSAAASLWMVAIATSTSTPGVTAAFEGDRSEEEALLEHEPSLDLILRIVIQRNPDLREAHQRSRGAHEMAGASGRLPDLELKYEQWGVPLARPYALNEAGTLMLGLRQTFPAPGSLAARSRAADEEARISGEAERGRRLEVIAGVRRAYAEAYRTEQEYRIHLEHVELASQVVELGRANYRAGRATQSDVLRALVELSRLHRDLSAIEQEKTSQRALLNTFMDRRPDAKLGVPSEPETIAESSFRVEELEKKLESSRPEVLSQLHAVRRSEAALESATKSARWPSFMIGADYWLQPASETKHAYGAMVSINLPWLNPKHGDEVRGAERALAADESGLRSVRNTARYQLHDALARYKAAGESFTIVDRDLLPQAKESFEAARAGFATGQTNALSILDTLRSLLDVRLEQVRARARLASIAADVDRLAGIDPTSRRREGDLHE